MKRQPRGAAFFTSERSGVQVVEHVCLDGPHAHLAALNPW